MTFDQKYYEERKKEILEDFNAFVMETYGEMERLVARKISKQNQLKQKMQELEAKMAKSKKDSKAKPEDNTVK